MSLTSCGITISFKKVPSLATCLRSAACSSTVPNKIYWWLSQCYDEGNRTSQLCSRECIRVKQKRILRQWLWIIFSAFCFIFLFSIFIFDFCCSCAGILCVFTRVRIYIATKASAQKTSNVTLGTLAMCFHMLRYNIIFIELYQSWTDKKELMSRFLQAKSLTNTFDIHLCIVSKQIAHEGYPGFVFRLFDMNFAIFRLCRKIVYSGTLILLLVAIASHDTNQFKRLSGNINRCKLISSHQFGVRDQQS